MTSRSYKLLGAMLIITLALQGILVALMLRPPEQSVTGDDAEVIFLSGGEDDKSYFDDAAILPMSEYTLSPWPGDVLIINWPHSITITDALSQTTVIAGPAMMQFGDQKNTSQGNAARKEP